MPNYSVYIVECADGTLYAGIATDVARRITEHNGEKAKGARYTSGRRPVRLVFEAPYATRSQALKEEARIKRLTRQEKQVLISSVSTQTPHPEERARRASRRMQGGETLPPREPAQHAHPSKIGRAHV